ncbi:ABC transporter substrate-binding protein [Aureimonas jatrophae]|uniref:Probable sugar-binding periplasmic protein n=1 Tax=Aureimonas jatrophae TaxID=1166073 RepID=A0A1H0D0T6_9HYPH|nr:ABC transporter substrate-binding protein [Aureimonas jatrophae]MBB3949444.1 glucose/mannose transport system substrate-binding protein [Aureimonas jatrophae]SDN63780.1 carbohydrate ABC transporter substrate-binding protein, CUT1 family [Aureimonas jatrophae]
MTLRTTCALAGVALLAITAFGPARAQSPERAEVMHWWTSGGEAAAVKVFADRFKAGGGEWVDSAVAGGEAARAAAINRIIGGNPPASSQFNTGRQFDDLVGQDLLADMSSVATEGNWTSVMPEAIVNAASRDGKFYAVPVNIHGQNWMFYNAATFQKAGITEAPTTFDALFAALDKLKAAGVTPMAWGGQAWQETLVFDAFLLGHVGKDNFIKIFRDHDTALVNSPEFKKSVEDFAKLRNYVDAGAPGRNWNDATAMVITGKAGVQIMGDWAKGDFINAKMTPGQDAGCALVPGDAGYVMGGDVFVFPKNGSDTPTTPQALLAKTMLDPETQIEFNNVKGSIPVRTDVDTSKMDACAQKGVSEVRDPAKQVPAATYMISADTTGQLQDAITNFFSNPSASADDFVATYADIIGSAD